MKITCTVEETSGQDNNCLGYALGGMLRCTPAELREAIACYVERIRDPEISRVVCQSVTERDDASSEEATACIRGGCFIPADVFVSYCIHCHMHLQRGNVVFLLRDGCRMSPICFYYDSVKLPTTYVCCTDNTHFERVHMALEDSVHFDLALFGDVYHGGDIEILCWEHSKRRAVPGGPHLQQLREGRTDPSL